MDVESYDTHLFEEPPFIKGVQAQTLTTLYLVMTKTARRNSNRLWERFGS
jgi:hypothetical protein